MTSLVALRSPHHEAFLPVDNTLDRKIVDLLEHNGIKQNDFLKIVQHCYTLHQPMQEIQSNSTRAFKLVAIWYLVALAIWGVFIFATAVTVPLAYRGAIEYNNQRDKARIWSAIEHFLQLANTGYENIKLSVKSERHTKFVDMYFFNESELSEKQNFMKKESDEFITIDLCDTPERSSHYYTTYNRLIDE